MVGGLGSANQVLEDLGEIDGRPAQRTTDAGVVEQVAEVKRASATERAMAP
jgi:hypothetical protein